MSKTYPKISIKNACRIRNCDENDDQEDSERGRNFAVIE